MEMKWAKHECALWGIACIARPTVHGAFLIPTLWLCGPLIWL